MFGGDRISSVVPRLRREDCGRTKYDRGFSKWQILVGPSDWEDYSLGKEGVEKYRVHNLPRDSGPGIYELGIAVIRTGFGRDVERLDPDRIVAAYLGQADNVRTRLQHYGRSGSHLGTASSTGPSMFGGGGINRGPGLFEDILSRGYPIVFRWATMQNKSEAKKIETQLLNTFDYGWNAADNGVRRPYDLLQKLKNISSSFPTNFTRSFVPFGQKRVGIRIIKPSDSGAEESLFSPVFKFGRSQPRLVQDRSRVIVQYNAAICGVVSGRGFVCQNPPVEGRKRCTDHKGMKIKGSSSLPLAQPSPSHEWINNPSDSRAEESLFSPDFKFGRSQPRLDQDRSGVIVQDNAAICGVVSGRGFVCQNPPVEGRKRCTDHKGMKINGSSSLSLAQPSPSHEWINKPSDSRAEESLFSPDFKFGRSQPRLVQDRSRVIVQDNAAICGVVSGCGFVCQNPPVEGRKRCTNHKGMKIKGSSSLSLAQPSPSHEWINKPSDFKFERSQPRLVQDRSGVIVQDNAAICGVVSGRGFVCQNSPVKGRKRCTDHKGMKINGSSSLSLAQPSPSHEWIRIQTESFGGSICGYILANGSPCKRQPIRGNKRCVNHKGKRIC